jgi:outer membrane cobalamin receptor
MNNMRRFYSILFLSLGLVFYGFSETQESFYHLSFDELLELQTEVATVFPTDELLVPASVSKITEDQWRMRGARVGIDEALDYLPGVASYPNLGGIGVSVRGYANFFSTLRGHSLLIDGIPMMRWEMGSALFHLSHLNLGLFSGVEMIRGPGSALYGNDAFHSVMVFQPWEPKQDIFEVSGIYGDHRRSGIDLRFSQGVKGKGRITSVFSVDGQGDQNIRYRSRLAHLSGEFDRAERFETGSGMIRWFSPPDEDFSYDLNFLFHQHQANEVSTMAIQFKGEDKMDTDTRLGLGWGKFLWNLKQGRKFEISAFHWNTSYDFVFNRAFTTRYLVGATETRRGIDFRLRSPEKGLRTRWVLGGGMDWQEIRETLDGVLEVGIKQLNIEGLKREIKNLYFHTETNLTHKNHLILGARIDDYPGFGTQFTPRAGLIHKADQNTSYKFLYGNAFRAPTARDLNSNSSGTTLGNPDLLPEEIDSYEFIIMHQLSKSSWNLTFFKSDWENEISRDKISAKTSQFFNSGRSKAQGVEVSWKGEISPEITLSLSGSRARARDEATQKDDLAFPKTIINIELEGKCENIDWRLGLRSMSDWNDQGNGSLPPSEPLGTYLRTDLTLKKEIEKDQEVYLYIRNLFDQTLTIPSIRESGYALPEKGIGARLGFRMRF